jgi:D-alanine-D-alanine ligase
MEASPQASAHASAAWTPWFLAPDGQVYAVSAAELGAFERPFEQDFRPSASPRYASVEAMLDAHAGSESVFFLGCMHGTFGENGALQALLEARGLAFTGSGAQASAQAFDKVLAKACVARAGGAVPEGISVPGDSVQAARAAIASLFERRGRIVVKRVADGSSVGLVHVRTEEDVERAAREVAEHVHTPYLAEVFAKGREFTVGVVEELDGSLRALPPSEVVLDDGSDFDFAGKYLGGAGTREITPAVAEPELLAAVQGLALEAHRSLGCEGYTRSDLIVAQGRPVYLETNTLPGLTKASFLPQQLGVLGIPVADFLREQLELAVRRVTRKQR